MGNSGLMVPFYSFGWVFPLKLWSQYYFFSLNAHRSNLLVTEEVWNVNKFFLFPFFSLFHPAFWSYIHIQEESGTKQLQTFSEHLVFELYLNWIKKISLSSQKSGFQIYSLLIILKTNLYQWQMRDDFNKSRISSFFTQISMKIHTQEWDDIVTEKEWDRINPTCSHLLPSQTS